MAMSCGISILTFTRNYQIAFQSLIFVNTFTIKIVKVPISVLLYEYSVLLDVNFWQPECKSEFPFSLPIYFNYLSNYPSNVSISSDH